MTFCLWEQLTPVHVVRKESLEIKHTGLAVAERTLGRGGSRLLGGPCSLWAGWVHPGWADSVQGTAKKGSAQHQQCLLCSPQAALRHRGVPGEVLALHADRSGGAHLWNGGQAAGGCLIRDQDTHGAGNGLILSPTCPAFSRRKCGGFHPMLRMKNWNLLPMVEWGKQGNGNLDHAFPCALAFWNLVTVGQPSVGCADLLPDHMAVSACRQWGNHRAPVGNSSIGRTSEKLLDPTKTSPCAAFTPASLLWKSFSLFLALANARTLWGMPSRSRKIQVERWSSSAGPGTGGLMGSGLLLLTLDRADRDVLWWVSSFLLRYWWPGHHSWKRLYICLWDPRDI